jgi:colanic acid biosynthesis glycosyl transferase WcaI
LRGKQILIVGINYAPELTGTGPYTTAMAEHLAARGAGVTVLTGLPHYPGWQVEDRYRVLRRHIELPANGAGPAVIRLRHHVPHQRNAPAGVRYTTTFLFNALTTTPPRPPDLVLAMTPSPGAAAAAARIARRHSVPLLLMVQDLGTPAGGHSDAALGGRIASRLERYALRRAGRVAVASQMLLDTVAGQDVPADRIDLLPNWMHIRAATQSRDEARDQLGWARDPFVVAHTGTMGSRQDLGVVVEAARRLPPGVELVLIGDGSRRTLLQTQAADLPQVRFLDLLDEENYPLALAAADLLLVHERSGVPNPALPSKLTSYLGAGRPIIAAVPGDGGTAAELERTDGAALVLRCGDPGLIAAGITALVGNPGLRARKAQAGTAYARQHLSPAESLGLLDDIVDRTLAGEARRARRSEDRLDVLPVVNDRDSDQLPKEFS